MRLSNIPCVVKAGSPLTAPTGKIPYIDLGTTRRPHSLGDSTLIIVSGHASHGRAPHRRASHRHVPHERASYGRVSHGHAPHCHVPHRRVHDAYLTCVYLTSKKLCAAKWVEVHAQQPVDQILDYPTSPPRPRHPPI